MGFAASQARFLSLTSRLLDNEYEAEQICQERVMLQSQMDIYTDAYEEALNDQVLVANVFDATGNPCEVTLTYDVIVKSVQDGGMGMKLVGANDQIVVPDEEEMQRQIDESGGTLTRSDFIIFDKVRDSDTLQKNLEEGNFFFAAQRTYDGAWDKKGVDQVDFVTHEYNKVDDASAKATYDKRMREAEKQDTLLEVNLEKLETEHNAIQTEMDSVQKVIDDNIEKGFGTFG